MDGTVIVDGANVMGSRADGWWRDRAGAMARLHGELEALAARGIPGPVPGGRPEPGGGHPEPGGGHPEPGGGHPEPGGGRWHPQIVLVVEGRARAVLGRIGEGGKVRVVAARGEGDDEIADLAGRTPGYRLVVTADRELRRRSEAAGATVLGPRWLTGLFG